MSAPIAHAAASGSARPRSGHFLAVVHSLLACFIEEFRLRRSLRQLSSYDDAMLRDIGVDRGSLESAVRFGRPATEGTLVYRTGAGRSTLMPSSLTELR